MFTRLERNVYAVLVVMALCAALVLASPAPAQAQAASTAKDTHNAHANTRENLSRVAVRPGDSLWTISEERLGPDATPQRILEGTEQIYALNRSWIGPDPSVIFVGQELLVPPAMSERHTGAPPEDRIAEAGPRDRVAEGTTVKETKPAPRTVVGGADAEGVEAPETPVQRSDGPVSLPALPDEASVPITAITVVASNGAQPSAIASFLSVIRTEFASAASTLDEVFFMGSADTRVEERRLLGLGILALTLVVAAFMAWKLPMRRTILRDAERWGTSSSYYGEIPTADRITPFVYHPGPLGGSDRNRAGWDTRPGALGAFDGVRRGSPMAGPGRKGSTPNVRGRALKARAVARNSLALGAHHPKVRSAPLRAHTSRRARKLRPRLRSRRGALRQSLPPSIVGQTGEVRNRERR